MIKYRITKYNPIFRNKEGYFDSTYEDWTCYSEIGKIFNNKLLDFASYLNIENSYVDSIKEILLELEMESLRVGFYRVFPSNNLNNLDVNSENLIQKTFTVKEDQIVNLELIDALIRLNLRSVIGCYLFSKKIIVTFGFDYYMYVSCDNELSHSLKNITSLGLFPEKLSESAFKEPKKIIGYSLKGDYLLLDDTIDISFVPLPKLRKIFNFSEEHPMNSIYEITEVIAERLQKIFNYKFDFDKYDYFLELEE